MSAILLDACHHSFPNLCKFCQFQTEKMSLICIMHIKLYVFNRYIKMYCIWTKVAKQLQNKKRKVKNFISPFGLQKYSCLLQIIFTVLIQLGIF